jgi:two-component system CheB/CheR fusion protein
VTSTDAPEDPGVESVLSHLRDTRAFDFTSYKRATLSRRIDKRMEQLGIGDHESYVDFLEVHPEEFEPLFNTILINVTSFFRDPDAWALLRDVAIPELLERRAGGPIRLWSAGCSSGQEAYSAVMLLAEAIGVDAVKERVKVYATDVDDEALDQARQAVFHGRELESLPDDLAERYFEPSSGGQAFNSDLRRVVIFGRHDLLQDAPISRIDLLLCRNTLMYFNADAQRLLVSRLHYSLAEDGYLMLGKVETLVGQGDLFEPIDPKRRLFRKLTPMSLRRRLLAMAGHEQATRLGAPSDQLAEVALELGADAQVILDAEGYLIAVNERARVDFGIPQELVGRPFQDLEISYRPVELRSAIDQARDEGRTVRLSEIPRWTPEGELTVLDVAVAPLSVDGEHLGVALSFVDVTRHRHLQEELEQTHRELATANEELQSANEELETTNEELQSTVEELETTNEELQSTNEELETMNEELSSTNEELHAINDELRDRTAEIDQVNAYLESVLTGFDASVIVIDRDLRVGVWNGLSTEMWGVRADEAEGRPFLALEIGYPVAVLGDALSATLTGSVQGEPILADATNRRGQPIRTSARVNRLLGSRGTVEGAIVIIEAMDR